MAGRAVLWPGGEHGSRFLITAAVRQRVRAQHAQQRPPGARQPGRRPYEL